MIDIQFSCKAPSSFILPIAYGSHMMANHMFSTAKDVSKMQNRLICFTALPGGFVEYTEPAMFGGEYSMSTQVHGANNSLLYQTS